MGVVYKAFDTRLERDVALKILRPEAMGDPEAKDRFLREARAASKLNHPNITTIHEINEWHGQNFICMEYVEGQTLREIVNAYYHKNCQLSIDNYQLTNKNVLNYAIQIAEAISEAHEQKIIHRDIKSENIIVTSKGQIKVMDFGLAKVEGTATRTKIGTTLGTVAYMSPEQTQGEDVDHRTDIWSFGVVLYEMITAQLPFKGEYEHAVIYSILNEEPKPISGLRSGVPLKLERIVNMAIVKNPDERYQHTDEMNVDLKKLQKDIVDGKSRIRPVPYIRVIDADFSACRQFLRHARLGFGGQALCACKSVRPCQLIIIITHATRQK